jgi:hypothetical protein
MPGFVVPGFAIPSAKRKTPSKYAAWGPQVVASTQAYLTGRRGVGGMGSRPIGLDTSKIGSTRANTMQITY